MIHFLHPDKVTQGGLTHLRNLFTLRLFTNSSQYQEQP